MTIDFSTISWDERPTLLLKNLDGTIIAPLSYAHNIELKANYNEISELTWTLPRYVDGVETEAYKDVVGMRIVDLPDVGQFSITNPKVTSKGGMLETKECKAYSLEYELQSKSTSYLIEGTYELYNPLTPDATALGILLKDYPSWKVGSFDSDLLGRYRTFDNITGSLYETMKDSFEEAYQCIFSFDTYARTIDVRSVSSIAATKQVYISHDNLAKEIEIEEDTENIFTALDVNGAEDVDIRSVNPMGTNIIYNLDYFMNTSYFSQALIDKWSQWKTTYENYRKPYYDLTVSKVLQESKLVTQNAAIIELTNELNKLTELQSVYVEEAANGTNRSKELADIKTDIANKTQEIADKREERDITQSIIDDAYADQLAINKECDWKNFFKNQDGTVDAETIKLIDRYIKQDSIEESSFVYKEYASYVTPDTAKGANSASFRIDGATVVGSTRQDDQEDNSKITHVYSITGGKLTLNATSADKTTFSFAGQVITASTEVTSTGKYVFTAYLQSGTQKETKGDVHNKSTFPRASLTIIGENCTITSGPEVDPEIGGDYVEGTIVAGESNTSDLYFTQNTTEYTKRSVEWDLYNFGWQQLNELAQPSYTFSVDSANFLAIEDFKLFKNQLELGEKIYLDIDGRVLEPICVGVEMSFEDPSQFKLIFGDKYSLKDSAFELVDLLEESVSMGKTVAKNRRSYNSFIESGASSQVRDFMNSALNAAKNMVLGGSNDETIIDGSGIRLRKFNDTTGDYEPEQVWLKSNLIAFTTDNWSSVKQAFGHMKNGSDVDVWGLIADSIIGKLIAGTNLTIESEKKDGGIAVFKVDGSGAVLHNSQFDVVNEYEVEGTNNKGWIKLQSPLGIVAGVDTSDAPLFGEDASGNGMYNNKGDLLKKIEGINYSDDTTLPRASFWADMYGNAFFKGNIYAEKGVFGGELRAATGSFTGVVKANDFLLDNGGSFKSVLNATKDAITGDYIESLTADKITAGTIDANKVTITNLVVGGNVTMGSNAYINWDHVQNHSTLDNSIAAAKSAADDAASNANTVAQDLVALVTGNYTKQGTTFISGKDIYSPNIHGTNINMYGGTFSIKSGDGTKTYGYIGRGTGNDGSSAETNGVVMSSGKYEKLTSGDNYIIVTNAGVRLQAGTNSLWLTTNGGVHKVVNGTSTEIGAAIFL